MWEGDLIPWFSVDPTSTVMVSTYFYWDYLLVWLLIKLEN